MSPHPDPSPGTEPRVTAVLALLDAHPGDRVPTLGTPWWREVEASLVAEPDAWRAAVDAPRAMTVDRAWVLLAWAEVAATVVLRERRRPTLIAAVQVLAMLYDGPVDRRDVMIVGPLVRRAADTARLDYPTAMTAACDLAGAHGPGAAIWLERVRPGIPYTHEEIDTGPAAPRFVRIGTSEQAVARELEQGPARRRWFRGRP